MSLINMCGEKYGRLMVVHKDVSRRSRAAYWVCECECGRVVSVRGAFLRSGHTRSCGCLRDESSSERLTKQNTKHGLHRERLYGIWSDMRKRCRNKKHWAFDRYGGRGISVCSEWDDFKVFYEWSMSNGYEDGLTIDRIDNDKGYNPENCRWVTRTVQANNKSNNTLYILNGAAYTIRQLSDMSGIGYSTLSNRIRIYGWTVADAVSKPVRGGDVKA